MDGSALLLGEGLLSQRVVSGEYVRLVAVARLTGGRRGDAHQPRENVKTAATAGSSGTRT